MSDFKDNFSKQSQVYAKYRLNYPPELFTYLSTLTKEHELAWDCGTGNGQSAVGLADHYKAVFATDPSSAQIKNATHHNRVIYKVEKAESCSLDDSSADIITVAQALHWFDFDRFYAEVNRVLKPGGIIAAWTYGLPRITPGVDRLVKHFHDNIVGVFWQPENKLVAEEYINIPFPFKEIESPEIIIKSHLTADHLLGLFSSWSATQRYIESKGHDPVPGIEDELKSIWGNVAEREAYWKLTLKTGRKD